MAAAAAPASSGRARLSSRAFALATLHACKHATRPVYGVFLGERGGGGSAVTEAVPLCHNAPLAPLLEMGLAQIEEYAAGKGLSLVGCYFAHESRNSADISPQCNRLASKIADNTERAFLVVLTSENLLSKVEAPIQWYERRDGLKWRLDEASSANAALADAEASLALAHDLVVRRRCEAQVCDFEEHLHDGRSDWTNARLEL